MKKAAAIICAIIVKNKKNDLANYPKNFTCSAV